MIDAQLFDTSAEFRFKVRSGTVKTCVVRYPTDEEWCARSRALKMVRQNLGHGKSQPVPTRPEIHDGKLFAAIRLDKDGPEFDDFEATQIVSGKLDAARVVSVEGGPGTYTLKLEAGKLTTSHTLRIPTAKQVLEHGRRSVSRIDSGRTQEMRVAMEPSGDLYDALVVKSEGYSGAVPINHKFAVIFEVLDELERDEDDPEE